jgi:hypothetical protein
MRCARCAIWRPFGRSTSVTFGREPGGSNCQPRSPGNIPMPGASGCGNGRFPRRGPTTTARQGQWRRHHLHESVLQRVVKDAARRRGAVDWRGLAARHVQATRQLLRKLLVGRLTFTPDPAGQVVRFTGLGTLAPLVGRLQLQGVQGVVTPAGFEPAVSTLKGSRPGPG